MSMVEEDVEFRDLLAQTLEKNGCLAKLRAELRASIFLALEEDIKVSKQQPLQNLRVQSYLQTPEGRTMFCLVREFLEFFNLQFTISVYEPESYLDSIGHYEGRQKVAKDLGLDSTDEPTVPLLQQLLKIAQSKSKILDINLNLNSNMNGSVKDDSFNVDSSYKKTESCNTNSIVSSNSLSCQTQGNKPEHLANNGHLNSTFDVNSPLSSTRKISDQYNNKDSLNEMVIMEEDDTQYIPDRNAENITKTVVNNVSKLEESNKSLERNGHFNETYELSSPTVNASLIKPSVIVPKCLKDIKEDDTYEDTSSIGEDSEALEKLINSINVSEENQNEVPSRNPSNSSNIESTESQKNSNSKSQEVEKPKLSPQRPKPSLSSLSDLPPLPLNKTRVSSDILPSLYSKEFKNKSNLKELDKMFDMEAEYEEDFMFSNDSSHSPVNSNKLKNKSSEESLNSQKDLDTLNMLNKKDLKNSTKVISDVGKSVLKPQNCSNSVKTGDHSNNSSISEYTGSESVNSAQ